MKPKKAKLDANGNIIPTDIEKNKKDKTAQHAGKKKNWKSVRDDMLLILLQEAGLVDLNENVISQD